MKWYIYQILIFMLFITWCSIATGQAGGSHAHSVFGKLRKVPFKPKFLKRPQSLNTEHINNVVEIFKRNVDRLRSNRKLDLVFVIDASYSVELPNFQDEVRFVSRFVSGIPVSHDTTRVAVITFADTATVWVDQVTTGNLHDHKCSLLGTSLPAITYASGSTYTLGGLTKAKKILDHARTDSKKVVLLITDGRSNGGDPIGVARRLQREGVEVFTFGVQSGNVDELNKIASSPKEDYVYVLASFAEFEAVARRALHADAEGGDYIIEDDHHCHKFCSGPTCCHPMGKCRCGTTTGIYECVCDAGHFGFGLLPAGCRPCPAGTYKELPAPGGPESCTPCPDANMISPNGSSSINQCTCIEGYEKIGNSCANVRCLMLKAPYNGRFKGLRCDNTYNSRCRVVCDPGYDIVGRSDLLCSITGQWVDAMGSVVKMPVCIARHCPALMPPSRVSINCSSEDLAYRTVCEFSCAPSYTFVGSKSLFCQADSSWDDIIGFCKEITCTAPSPPLGGNISNDCLVTRGDTLTYGASCYMTCPSGFALSVNNETTCIEENRWSVDTSHAECIDNELPVITCPDEIVVVANAHFDTTAVSWQVPVPTDNSGKVFVSARPSVAPPAAFNIGKFAVEYIATDATGLQSYCNFTVTVVDKEPPMIEECKNPAPFVVTDGETIVHNARWKEPSFSDNSRSVFVNRSRAFGDLPFGQTKVTYIASDPSGNNKTCVIVVSVQNNKCPQLDNPKYGHKLCQMDYMNLAGCELLCDSKRYGMAMAEHTPYYTCQANAKWHPTPGIPMDCSHQRYSSEIVKGFRSQFDMTQGSCNDTGFLDSVKDTFVKWLTPAVPRWCERAAINLRCNLVSVHVACIQTPKPLPPTPDEGDYYTGYGGDSDSYYGAEYEPAKRKRRETQGRLRRSDEEPIPDDAMYGYDYGPSENEMAEEPNTSPIANLDLSEILSMSDDAVLRLIPESGEMDHFIEVTYTIRGEVNISNDDNVVGSRQLHGQMSEFFGQLDTSHQFSNQYSVYNKNKTKKIYIVYKPNTYTSSHPELKCPLGAVLREAATCVNCPIGTFYDVTTAECVSCAEGYYQDVEAQLSCKACPDDTSTPGIHARSRAECKDLCAPGTHSHNGLETCIACPVHTYSDVFGEVECTLCPPETGTTATGTSSYQECGPLCTAGQASWTGIEPCYPCPLNTYQFKTGQQSCYKCPATTHTDGKGSTSYQNCSGIQLHVRGIPSEEQILGLHVVNSTLPFSSCFLDPCKNGARCKSGSAGHVCVCLPGYTGVNCETDINECLSNPCYNAGSCTDEINGYRCHCQTGYEGTQCETDTNECESTPCQHNATCIDKLATYQCHCSAGFSGSNCEININECATSPCDNGATCIDKVAHYICMCAVGFTGTDCQIDIDDCIGRPCLNQGTCHDHTNAFDCHCKSGFVGELCEVNVDDCVGVTCANGGSCVDGVDSHRCACAPTFTGASCETKLLPDFDLSFSNPNTYHHVHFKDGFGNNMTEITVAFYMFSNYTESQGTPFSYAIGKKRLADVFTLTNLEALTLYVNGESVVTDTRKLNDGTWYHVVVTWKSEDGSWQIFLNQHLEASGTGLQNGSVIPGGGIMVIGQEQDCLGGCFSSSQEFIGEISQFNVYDYVMDKRQVFSLYFNCLSNEGNVRAWPDALGGIKGHIVTIRPRTFCQSCNPIQEVDHLSVQKQGAHKSWVSCQNGFQLYTRVGIGSRRAKTTLLRCGNRGLWKHAGSEVQQPSQKFFCVRTRCKAFSTPPLVIADSTSRQFNDTVNFSCNIGYELHGATAIRCQADQKWSAPVPTCVDIDECVNDHLCHHTAYCINTEGSHECYCNWGYTGDGFNCTLIDCGYPPKLEHGTIHDHSHHLEHIIEHECDVGYELNGPEERSCQENATWSGHPPTCDVIECPEPIPLTHGRVTTESITYLSKAIYECDPGFILNGDHNRTCLETKVWSGEVPVCEPVQCPDFPFIDHGSVEPYELAYYFTDQVHVTCDKGYRIEGDPTLRCNEDASWEGHKPSCVPDLCDPPLDVANGQIQGTNFAFMSTIEYVCDVGYLLNGTGIITCLEGPMWSSEAPQCKPVPCPAIAAIPHGNHYEMGTVFGDQVTYQCEPGYYMVGKEILFCLSSGLWGDKFTNQPESAPLCLPVPCGPPPEVGNGYYELFGSDDFVYGSHIKYSCETGYFPVNANILSCGADRSWNISSSHPFRCDPVPCSHPGAPKHGRIVNAGDHTGISYIFGDVVDFDCNEGFNRVGAHTIQCISNGTWSKQVPACHPVHCGQPPNISNANLEIHDGPHKPGPHFQSHVKYTCNQGYYLITQNDGIKMCQSNAMWADNKVACERVSCGKPTLISHGYPSTNDTLLFGDVTIYSCDVGFQMAANDSDKVQCTWRGEFSRLPVCEPLLCGEPGTVPYSTLTVQHPHANNAFESSIHYSCERDFKIIGISTVTCLDTGKWSNALPKCKHIACVKPGSIQNGFSFVASSDAQYPYLYGKESFAPRSAILSACHNGYEIAGREATEVGLRSSSPDLSSSSHMTKQQIIEKLQTVGDQLSLTQKAKLTAGLERFFGQTNTKEVATIRSVNIRSPDVEVRTCSPVGAWLRSAPRCVPMMCPPPPDQIHGHVVINKAQTYHYQSQLNFECDEGYEMLNGKNRTSITCEWMNEVGTVQWTQLQHCNPVPCPKPLLAEHSNYTVDTSADSRLFFTFMDSISYSCSPGYDLIGKANMFCTSQGLWSHPPPLCDPVECPVIQAIDHGFVHQTSNTFQSTVSYTCNPGFEMHGENTATCEADRSWSSPIPSCDPIPCGPSPTVNYATSETTSEVFGGEATYTCDPGFYLNGSDYVNCDETGAWSPQLPECIRIKCHAPLLNDHASFHVASFPDVTNLTDLTVSQFIEYSYVYETAIHFTCNTGYKTDEIDPIRAICTEYELWSRESTVCKPKDCGPAPNADVNGYSEGSLTTYGNHYNYKCNLGYFTIASSIKIYCTENGVWSASSVPTCLPVQCEVPIDPHNGHHTGDAYHFPLGVNYTCDQGYDLLGADHAFCEPSGEWNKPAPQCVPVDCGMLPDIENAVLNTTTTYYQSSATYTCLPGHEMFGENILFCEWDELWDYEPPECLPVDCGSPGSPLNGDAMGDSHVFRATVFFACHDGYILDGAENATCLPDGFWDHSTPMCHPVDCEGPPEVDHSDILWDGTSTTFHSTVMYKCHRGYELVDPTFASVECLADGMWSPSPQCSRVKCPKPETPRHGRLVVSEQGVFLYQETVHFSCDKGYLPSGKTTANCTAEKTWSSPSPSCNPKDCGRLPTVRNSKKTGNDTLFMATVSFVCNPGFESQSNMTLTCLHTGWWDREIPVCSPVSCGPPPTVRHSTSTGGSSPDMQIYESLVAYHCNKGFYLTGPTNAVCGADKSWQFGAELGPGGATINHLPTCRRVHCPLPPAVANGTFSQRNYTYGEEVVYMCDRGHDLINLSKRFECTAFEGDFKGFYMGVPPICEPVSCGMPKTIKNGFFVSKGTTFTKSASYSCNHGHYAAGPVEIRCQANRTWSSSPACLPHDCKQPPEVAHARVNVTSTIFGSVLNYQCDVGYDLHGSGTTECLGSAAWSDVSDWSCDPVPCGEPTAVVNSTFASTGHVYGDSVTYTCDSGFLLQPPTLSHQRSLACQSSGHWEVPDFHCKPVSCGAIPLITNGKVQFTQAHWPATSMESVFYPDVLEYSCDIGYYMEGVPRISCTNNGTFSLASPYCLPVICGAPEPIPMATVSADGVTFGHKATYTCNVGHKIRSAETETNTHHVTCTSDEVWYPAVPAGGCQPVICRDLPVIEHVTMTTLPSKVNLYQDVVKYQCDAGYELSSGDLDIRCQANKEWSSQPQCSPVDCGIPVCPGLSSCHYTGTTYQHIATAQCLTGHEFSSNVINYKITCAADRQWTVPEMPPDGDASTCRKISCGIPEVIDHGTYRLRNNRVTYQENVTYSCDRGYEFTPNSVDTMSCLSNKMWGPSSVPACQAKNCGHLVCPQNAACKSDGTTYLSTFHVTCDVGYELHYDVFDTSLACLDTGTWSTIPYDLICEPVKCPKPQPISFGKITTHNSNISPEYNEVVNYECDEGYYMLGKSQRTCTSTRTYSHNLPHCLPVSCGAPALLQHGIANFDGLTFERRASYKCLPGYKLLGNGNWVCSHTRKWIPLRSGLVHPPIVLPLIQRQRRSVEGSGSGDAIELGSGEIDASASSYVGLSHSNAPKSIHFRSALSVPDILALPTCEPISCGKAPLLMHGTQVNITIDFVFGQSVSYICDDGFFLKGSSSLSCLEDGTFGPSSPPSCQRTSCGEPLSLMHGTYTAASVTGGTALFVFEDVVTYNCNVGYEHQEPSPVKVLTCTDQERWEPTSGPSKCHPVSCGTPPVSDHILTTGHVYTFNSSVDYNCEPGYRLVGSVNARCTAGKVWSPKQAPTCAAVSCGRPNIVLHASYTNQQSQDENDFTFKRSVTYSCEPGYHLELDRGANENAILTCQSTGIWSNLPPRCPPVSCGTPSSILNGQFNGSVHTFGKQVTYGCNVGYEMTGDPVSICQADRTWSGPLPTCSPVSCDRAPHVTNSKYKLSSALFLGNTVSYVCDSGYEMSGESTLTCTATRVFDHPPPTCIPVSCGDPGSIDHGVVSASSGAYTFGHNLTYTCDVGHEMKNGLASKTIKCTASKSWSSSLPVCHPITCGAPMILQNGDVAFTTETYSSKASYSCHPGYELSGSSSDEGCPSGNLCKVCQANKVWGFGNALAEAIPIRCNALSCVEPTRIQNGRTIVDSYTFESVLQFVCDDGYELYPATDSHQSCQANYQWGPKPAPICRRVSCQAPFPINHGSFHRVDLTSSADKRTSHRVYLFEDLVQYECDSGYRFFNPKKSETVGSLLCRANATWDQETPICEPVPCGNAPPRQNGRLVSADVNKVTGGYVYGQTATYSCDLGYEFTGSKMEESLTCTQNGKWSRSEAPACYRVICGADPQVTNSEIIASDGGTPSRRTFGSTITYRCKRGYFLLGSATIECTSDRAWSPAPPNCVPVQCGEAPHINHASVVRTAMPILVRSANAFSHGSGEGSAEPLPEKAHWQIDAAARLAPRSAFSHIGTTYVFGDVVHFECDRGYVNNKSAWTSATCGPDGEWIRPLPKCEPVPCKPMPPIKNAKRLGDSFTFGGQISYTCDEGFQPTGNSELSFTCNADGQFQPLTITTHGELQQPSCQRVSCGEPSGIAHGFVSGNITNYVFEEVLHYVCKPGFRMIGEPELRCDANKKFDGVLPTCQRISCGQPPIVPNTVQYVGSTDYEGIATYHCATGFVGTTGQITCQADARWSTSSITCEKVDCNIPPTITFGSVDINGTTFGDLAVYHCHPGYIRSGNFERVCQETGEWSATCPVCSPVDCGPPNEPSHGNILPQGNYTFGEIVIYNCDSGYDLLGSMITMCLATGNWSAQVPACTRVSCGHAPTVAKARIVFPSHHEVRYGDNVTYECDFGHEVHTPLVLRCESDGFFDNFPPACQPRSCGTPPDLKNAYLVSENHTNVRYGDKVMYACAKGHVVTNEVIVLECTGSGTFTQPSTECAPIECPPMPEIANGQLTINTGHYLDEMSLVCDNGYTLQGTGKFICEANGAWSNTSSSCSPVSCGSAPIVENSHPIDEHTDYTYGMSVHFACDRGYKFSSVNGQQKSCQADGTYSPQVIKCEPVVCGELPPIYDGSLNLDSLEYRANGSATCYKGFHFSSGEDIVYFSCQWNGLWSVDLSTKTCVPVPCAVLPIVQHSTHVLERAISETTLNGVIRSSANVQLYNGDVIMYSCDNGYKLEGSPVIECRDTGTWSSRIPVCNPVECGRAPEVDNAKSSDTNHTYGTTATYECIVGHVATGDVMSRVCQANGNFSQERVECSPQRCQPFQVNNGWATPDTGGVFNDLVTISCDPGYELLGGDNLTRCESSGLWSGTLPHCFPVECGRPPYISYSRIESTGSMFGDNATATCKDGYKFNNGQHSIVMRCQADRQWSRNLGEIKCDPILCEAISGITNGEITVIPRLQRPTTNENKISKPSSSFEFGNKLSFKCHSGYKIKGGIINCQANRSWSGPPAQCTPVECLNPPQADNARLTSTSHHFGQKAEYECNVGHYLTSAGNFRICRADGSFSTHHVTCSRVPCNPLPVVKNARVVPVVSHPVYGDLAHTRCDRGYNLAGNETFECLASGDWNQPEHTCEPTICGTAPHISNAHSPSAAEIVYSFGDSVHYDCDRGYHNVSGSYLVQCNADGTFENASLLCEPVQCPQPPVIEHASIRGSEPRYGNDISVSCKPGYEMTSGKSDVTITCQFNGEWSRDFKSVQCVGIKCDVLKEVRDGSTDLSFADIRNETAVFPSTVIYTCNNGYTLVGRSKRKCDEDGSWTGREPSCLAVDCGPPPAPLHGFVSGDKTTTFGSIVNYECQKGFAITSTHQVERICLESGSWSGTPPTCQVVTCKMEANILNAIPSNIDSVVYGQTVTVECLRGFRIMGAATRTCQETGQLDEDPPSCDPVSCGRHPPVHGALIKPDTEALFNDTVNITCEKGTKLFFGDSKRTCQQDGSWSGKMPNCAADRSMLLALPIRCEAPKIEGKHIKLTNDEKLQLFYEAFTTLTFRCLRGYVPFSELITTCDQGQWTSQPKCISKCKHLCRHRGTCTDGGSCSCVRGWTGSSCHRPHCLLPCLNGGYCSAPFKCLCSSGWGGSRCQTPICHIPCANGGICMAPNQCKCPRGYYGNDCSKSVYFSLW